MAFVTYILLAALHSGLNSRFHPEILGITASKALAVVLFDFCFVKSGCYLLNIPVRFPSEPMSSLSTDPLSRAGFQANSWIFSLTEDTSSLGTWRTFCVSFELPLNDVCVSVIVTLVAALLGFGNSLYLLVFVYTFLSTAFFLVRHSDSEILSPRRCAHTHDTAPVVTLDGPSRCICHCRSGEPIAAVTTHHIPLPGRRLSSTVHGLARACVARHCRRTTIVRAQTSLGNGQLSEKDPTRVRVLETSGG